MITKRHFLMGSATAVAATPGFALDAGKQFAATRPRLDEHAGLATWQAFVGQSFEIGGSSLQLTRVAARDATGLQFSLSFEPLEGPATEGLHTLVHADSERFDLYLATTPQGLRADFCRQPT